MDTKDIMHRRTYWTPDSLDKAMNEYSEATKLSKSDIARVAINEYLRAHPLNIEKDEKVIN